jgi:hypothetical protein
MSVRVRVPSDSVLQLRPETAPAPVPATGGGERALRRLRSERGVALTEFALILPVLMLLLIGMLEFGKALNYWIDQTHLANQGARWAAVNRNPSLTPGTQSLQQYIAARANTDELELGGTKNIQAPLSVFICFPTGSTNVGQPVRVIVSTTYHWLPLIGAKVGASVPIRGTATMRIEAKPVNYAANGPCPAGT